MPRNETYVQYRRNLSDFNRWEDEEKKKQNEAIEAFKRHERESRPGYKLPLWLVVLGAILLSGALSWVYITLAFSAGN